MQMVHLSQIYPKPCSQRKINCIVENLFANQFFKFEQHLHNSKFEQHLHNSKFEQHLHNSKFDVNAAFATFVPGMQS